MPSGRADVFASFARRRAKLCRHSQWDYKPGPLPGPEAGRWFPHTAVRVLHHRYSIGWCDGFTGEQGPGIDTHDFYRSVAPGHWQCAFSRIRDLSGGQGPRCRTLERKHATLKVWLRRTRKCGAFRQHLETAFVGSKIRAEELHVGEQDRKIRNI